MIPKGNETKWFVVFKMGYEKHFYDVCFDHDCIGVIDGKTQAEAAALADKLFGKGYSQIIHYKPDMQPFPRGFINITENLEEFKLIQRFYPLASKVIAAATTREEGAWCAYCNAVPGIKHVEEWQDVLDYGDKLSEEIASAIFPSFAKMQLPYAR